jgi:ribokinase
LITVDDAAENTIVVVPGANGTIGTDDLASVQKLLSDAQVLLLQLEIPLEAVVQAAQLAHERGITVILDPAPARHFPTELYRLTDIITPNETEAEMLVGFKVNDEANAARAASVFLELGVQHAVIKMGGNGVYWASKSISRFLPAYRVKAVDTVAAGDAFNGGLASGLSEGLDFENAIKRGLAVAALSVTKAGAQPSMPTREEMLVFLNSRQ